MKAFSSFFIFIILNIYFFSGLISSQEVNSTENDTESFYDANESSLVDEDPYKDIDFGNLINLHDSNFTSEMKKYELIYLMFYSDYCEFCSIFIPQYVAASKYAEENNMTVKFAKIDSSISANITEQYGVTSFPTVYLVNNTEKYLFAGEKSKEGLIKFVDRKSHDDVYDIEKLSEIEKYTNSSTVILSTLRYFNTMLYFSFFNYSKTNMNVDFVRCLSEECLRKYGHNIVIYKNFDEKINTYTKEVGAVSEAHPDSVKDFFGMYGIEAGAPLTDIEINMMFEHKRKMLFFFRNAYDTEQTKYDKVIKELGLEYRKEKIYTVVADIEGNDLYQNIGQTFVIVPQDLPTLLFYDLGTDENNATMVNIYSIRNATQDQLKKESIKEYIQKIKDKKIREDLYSQPPLEHYNVSGLKYIIGRTYDSDVIEEKKNVFISLIDGSSYCPECDTILDLMDNLTKIYKPEENNIVFAFMDLSRNQPRDVRLDQPLPIILLYTNAMPDKQIIQFTPKNISEINIGEMEDFLCKNLKWDKKGQKEQTKEKKKEKEVKGSENKKEDKKDKKVTDL